MLTENAFTEHKKTYTILKKAAVLDHYYNETNKFIPGGTVYTMLTPITDEASIAEYGESIRDMLQGVIYDDDTAIDTHDQIEVEGSKYEFVSIKKFPSYRLVQIRLVKDGGNN